MRKTLHLKGFDPPQHIIDPELRWNYDGLMVLHQLSSFLHSQNHRNRNILHRPNYRRSVYENPKALCSFKNLIFKLVIFASWPSNYPSIEIQHLCSKGYTNSLKERNISLDYKFITILSKRMSAS